MAQHFGLIHIPLQRTMCLAQELRRSLSKKKRFDFLFGATPPPPTSIFSATRKKKRGTTTFAATCYQRINHQNMIRVKASQNILFALFFVDTNKEMQLQLDIVLRKYEFETLLISK